MKAMYDRLSIQLRWGEKCTYRIFVRKPLEERLTLRPSNQVLGLCGWEVEGPGSGSCAMEGLHCLRC
jgi:hypothetical protein